MRLSVIIVNYNVKYFLEQCLLSVDKAIVRVDEYYKQNGEIEVFVVDNNSVDGSVEMLRKRFSDYHLILNKENLGFAKANNQAMTRVKGAYVLLLNPDTLIEEDTFKKCMQYMDTHLDVGGLGVKLIDGKGKFLPESKRALPSPEVAFYKIFGLASLFPKSKRFGKYYLSYLDENKTYEVPILAGAFMFMRKSVLDKIGLLDEQFFMYGEDIDLSYRIVKAGYKNVYFSETKIIHYKGESTKKGSLNYVYFFYKAMKIFADKHFSQNNARWYALLIDIAIYFRAGLSAIRRVFEKIILPLIDFVALFFAFYVAKELWESWKWEGADYYSPLFTQFYIPLYSLVIILALWIKKSYRKTYKLIDILSGLGLGSLLLGIFYAFLSENMRFSRAILLVGLFFSLVFLPFSRLLLSKISIFRFYRDKALKIILLGEENEIQNVEKILSVNTHKMKIIGFVSETGYSEKVLGNLSQIKEIIKIHKPDELIFCSGSLTTNEIIKTIQELSDTHLQFKIAPKKSLAIIGSNSIHTNGEFYALDLDFLSKKENIWRKRIADILISLSLLIFSPILYFLQNKNFLFRNIYTVLKGEKTWIGLPENYELGKDFPFLKKGILFPVSFDLFKLGKKEIHAVFVDYAKKYRVTNDLFIIFSAYKKLGN